MTGAGFGGCVVALARPRGRRRGRDRARPSSATGGPTGITHRSRSASARGRRGREGRVITREELRDAQVVRGASSSRRPGSCSPDAEREAIGSPRGAQSAILERFGPRAAGLRQHRSVPREGARALPAPDVLRASPSAVVGSDPGKMETFRCRSGLVRLWVARRGARPPARGEQHTIPPDTLHSFRAGPEGAIVSEFSSASRDDLDVFTDPAVERATVVDA